MKTIRHAPALAFFGFSAAAAAVAALAAGTSAALTLPVWAMFVGWIAYFTRGGGLRQALEAAACVMLGIVIGMAASLALGVFGPMLGAAALPLVVFVVAMLVLTLRAVPLINNVPAYFLGLVAHFAGHLAPSSAAFLELGSAGLIGSCAGWLAHRAQRRWAHA